MKIRKSGYVLPVAIGVLVLASLGLLLFSGIESDKNKIPEKENKVTTVATSTSNSVEVSIKSDDVSIDAYSAIIDMQIKVLENADLDIGRSMTDTSKILNNSNKEVERRVAVLTNLSEKIKNMKKVADADKAGFIATIQNQIDLLNSLKIKIGADKSTAVAKEYKVYALILPQLQIIANADGLASTTDLVAVFANKLQEMEGAEALLTLMQAKISDASVKSVNAIIGVVGLKSDDGDKAVMASNTKSLKNARISIQNGIQDIKDAQKIATKILKNSVR